MTIAAGARVKLSVDALRSGALATRDMLLPTPELLALPEKAVQFGTGAFLRGFVDFFVDEANRRGAFDGRIVAIGSTESGREAALGNQDGLFTLLVEGLVDGTAYRECRIVASVSRALSAPRDWDAVMSVARNPAIELVFSNTTEVGIAIEDGDLVDAAPPPSFPGKLAAFLLERGRALAYAKEAGVVVIPCELIERNGDRLRELVLTLAERWKVEPAFAEWIEAAVPFCNTLVDRIVPGRPDEMQRRELAAALAVEDDLAIVAEPYRLFAIEANDDVRRRLRFAAADEGIVRTHDVTPYRERKVRILNGGHTLIAAMGLLVSCETVREAIDHPLLGWYLRTVLFDEIVPSLAVPGGEAFARDVLDRFANPYLRHALRDITLQQTTKMRVRVVPSIERAAATMGRVPPSLCFGFAAYLLFVRQSLRGLAVGTDTAGGRVRAAWRAAPDESDASLRLVVAEIGADRALWRADLASIPGFVDTTTTHLVRMIHAGVAAALETHLASDVAHLRAAPSPVNDE